MSDKDTIYRQDAIDALEKWESESTWDEWCYDHKDEAEKYNIVSPSSVVFNLPSAQPNAQWISYSEKLPEEDGVYIVYAPYYSGGSSSAKECHNGVMFSKYKNGKWSIEHGYYSRPNCVKAWKPLDEPWRGKGEPK